MKRALEHIDRKNETFAKHAMIEYLKDEAIPASQRLVFAPYMAHFVFSFMDINRFVLRDLKADDNEYQHLVNIHTDEDAHHWPWYLNDLQKLHLDKTGRFTESLRFIWSDHGIQSRMLTYDMVGLVKNASPIGKVILVEVIEKTGNVFLAQTAEVSRELGDNGDYLYYGKHHLDCETGHHMGTDQIESVLASIVLSDDEFNEGIAIIDEAYSLYGRFLTEMLAYAQAHHHEDMAVSATYPGAISQHLSHATDGSAVTGSDA